MVPVGRRAPPPFCGVISVVADAFPTRQPLVNATVGPDVNREQDQQEPAARVTKTWQPVCAVYEVIVPVAYRPVPVARSRVPANGVSMRRRLVLTRDAPEVHV